MAYLNTRGTLVRDRLDFYETSNCWAFVSGQVATGNIVAYLINNASSALQLDVYGVQWYSSTPQVWVLALRPPVQTITPLTPNDIAVRCIQPDLPTPLGLVGMATAFASNIFYTILRQSGGATSGSLDIGYGTAHTVLPPGYAITVSTTVSSATELSFTVFYQSVLDNVPPAQ